MVLAHLKPAAFFKHFEAISAIPRGSGNERAVSDFVVGFARGLGYRVVQDALYNVIIYKDASPGYENKPAVILQGHLDMVCEKNTDTVHDFTRDGLDLYIDGEFVKARGTTLGADNGTAVAMCMAILEDKALAHPPLEMILTVEEETGMAGAQALDAGLFKATRMINLDSSEEGIITVGCAAGVTVDYDIPLTWEAPAACGYTAPQPAALRIRGLHGGHSGADIDKGRANALMLLGCVLTALDKECAFRLSYASGGMKLNAIPREAEAALYFSAEEAGKITACINECNTAFRKMYHATEPGLVISIEPGALPERVLASESADALIASLLLLPNGVQAMSADMPGLVAASCNVGVLETTDTALRLQCFPRGATTDYLKGMEQQIQTLAARTGAVAKFIRRSPAWAYNPDSALLAHTVAAYEAQYAKKPVVTALHAGLECGILAEKLPGLDIVSLGPDTYDLHTPDERLRIASVGRVWGFLCDLLAGL